MRGMGHSVSNYDGTYQAYIDNRPDVFGFEATFHLAGKTGRFGGLESYIGGGLRYAKSSRTLADAYDHRSYEWT